MRTDRGSGHLGGGGCTLDAAGGAVHSCCSRGSASWGGYGGWMQGCEYWEGVHPGGEHGIDAFREVHLGVHPGEEGAFMLQQRECILDAPSPSCKQNDTRL